MLDTITLIVYLITLVMLWMAYKSERLDLQCPYPSAPKSKCGTFGKGMAYQGTEPHKDDQVPQLLNKIEKATYTEELTVKWRRAYIIAFLISVSVWLLVVYPLCDGLPNGAQWVLTLLIAYFFIYFSFSFYYFHHYYSPTNFTRESINMIRNELNLKRENRLDTLNGR